MVRVSRVWAVVMILAIALSLSGLDRSQVHGEQPNDVYFSTPGMVSGPAAPAPAEIHYPRYGSLDNRLLIWFVTQQHTYFAGFVLALPIFCVLLEFMGLITRNPALATRYDGLARDLIQVALLALSVTAVVGSLMLGHFIAL
jgi:cytochrome d ubiquinol oxidase subunit I